MLVRSVETLPRAGWFLVIREVLRDELRALQLPAKTHATEPEVKPRLPITAYNPHLLSNRGRQRVMKSSEVPILHLELYLSFFRLFRATNDYKSNLQQDACVLALANKDSALLVGPTSAGKSLFWLLRAIIESECQTVTVVMVPLRRLLNDFLDKALAHGIPPPGGPPKST
ncbi:hypothetical protein JCM24511_10089 [Saitozyma sp. JCM 24511]|nr:hypothetical protein JCM24511_10089 [Saitozyma sp. JCM 24511]